MVLNVFVNVRHSGQPTKALFLNEAVAKVVNCVC